MNTMNRDEWLASLKVGDEVVYRRNDRAEPARVERITPKRNRFELRLLVSVGLDGGPRFAGPRFAEVNKDGRAPSHYLWRIEPLTPEWRAEQELKARRERLNDIFCGFRFYDLTPAQLDAAEPLVAQLARVLRGET